MSFNPETFNLTGTFGDYKRVGNRDYGEFFDQYKNWAVLAKHRDSLYGIEPPSPYITGRASLRQFGLLTQHGNQKIVAFAPYLLAPYYDRYGLESYDVRNMREYLERSKVPEEAAWFYVDSIIIDGHADYLKARGEDDVTKAPLKLINRNNWGSAWSAEKAIAKGMSVTPNNEDVTTIVNGHPITRKGLDFTFAPATDEWLKRSDLPFTGTSSTLLHTWSTQFKFFGYFTSILDAFSRHTAEYYYNEENLKRFNYATNFSELTHRSYSKDTTAHTTVALSFLKRPYSTRNIVETNITKTMTTHNQDILDGVIPNDVTDQSYKRDSRGRRPIELGLGIRVGANPDTLKHLYMLPDTSMPVAVREEEEFQIMNENYMKAIHARKGLSFFMTAARIANPLTQAGVIISLLRGKPGILQTYIDEQARKKDAEANMSGDVQFHIGGTLYMSSDETITITTPTHQAHYTKDGEKVHATDTFEELPVNQLFKSVYEFEQYLKQWPDLFRTRIRYKVRPFMEIGEYEPMFEHWSREPKPRADTQLYRNYY